MAVHVDLKFEPHVGTPALPGGQLRLISLTMQYRRVVCPVGRRWGKTQGAKMAILAHYQKPSMAGRSYRAAYCAPTYVAAKREYNEAKEMFGGAKGKGLIADKSDSDLWIKLKAVKTVDGGETKGGLIQFWSLDSTAHENRRGDRLDFVVLDEATDIEESAWEATVKPMLMDALGHALIIGTPKRRGKGFQWFRREFHRGFDPAYTEHANMTGPSEGNPYIDPAVIANERQECATKATEREEYSAEFLDEEGAVFERLDEAFVLPFNAIGQHRYKGADPEDGARYLIGYDIGRHDDPSIITIFDEKAREQVYLWRGNGIPFREQIRELTKLRRRYNSATVFVDANGMGEAVLEDLRRRFGESVRQRKWNNARKEADVTRAGRLFQLAEWRFLAVPWQKQEFYAYTAKKLPSGGYRYEASPGHHDDTVAAACMLAHRIEREEGRKPKATPRVDMVTDDGKLNYEWWEQDEKRRKGGGSFMI